MNIVIGSGPAGMAAAQALLAQGEPVLLLDAGLRLEAEQEDLLARIKRQEAGAVEQLTTRYLDTPASRKGIELKLAYGSDFMYRDADRHLGFEGSGTGLLPSLAQGGLSNVWGAAILPYRQEDIGDWPVTAAELAPHYEAVLPMTGLAARNDDLARLFPLHAAKLNRLELSSQARYFLAGLDRSKAALERDGITYGTARLAAGPNQGQDHDCVYCGKCLYGCPYGVIYNSAQELASLSVRHPGLFTHRSDVIVDTLAEADGKVAVRAHDRCSQAPVQLEAERVFLGAGAIPSSRILLKSLGAYDHPLTLLDSQYFILPVLSARGHPQAVREALYTLSQLFLEIEDEQLSPYTIHLQLYTYNDLIPKVLRAKLWFMPGLRELLVRPLQHRLFVIQGYLHSAHSGTIGLRLTRDAASGRERLIVEGHANAEAGVIIRRLAKKLTRHLSRLGLLPLTPAVDITPPGRGFHSGGSFPMRAAPSAFESDRLGRVHGLDRIHLIDASVFPSIPATTITLTAMANAHRIASTWKKELA